MARIEHLTRRKLEGESSIKATGDCRCPEQSLVLVWLRVASCVAANYANFVLLAFRVSIGDVADA